MKKMINCRPFKEFIKAVRRPGIVRLSVAAGVLVWLSFANASATGADLTLVHISGNTYEVREKGGSALSTDQFSSFHCTIMYNSNTYGTLTFTVTNSYYTTVSDVGTSNDPGLTNYTMENFDFAASTGTVGGSGWSSGTEYPIFRFTVTGYNGNGNLYLAYEATATYAYSYVELNQGTDITDGSPYFYGGSAVGSPPSGYTMYDYGISSLPVSLYAFEAAAVKNSAQLDWTTVSEINNKGFFLERSENGVSWQPVTFVSSASVSGNSQEKLSYAYTDENVFSGGAAAVIYYRLRQQDYDGKEEYVGGVKAVRFEAGPFLVEVKVFPNPASGVLNVNTSVGGILLASLVDISGRTVYSTEFNGKQAINVSAIAPGIYTLVISNKDGRVASVNKVSIGR